MHETVVGLDNAYVTVEDATEELENLPTEEVEAEDAPPKLDMNELSVQVIQALRQIHQSGDTFAAIVCNPSILEEFTAVFRALPSEILPDHVREQLPIVPDPNVDRLKIITGTDIELQFLQVRYGPRNDGGNGLIEDIKSALDREQSPVRVPTDFLRTIYLMELVDKVKPKIYTPNGADVLHQLSQQNLRR